MFTMPPMRPIRHIIWDWNGTLLDDADACLASINIMLRGRGLPEIGMDFYRDTFGFPVKEFYRRVGFELERENWDCVAQEYHRHYARIARTCSLRPGTAAHLTRLKTHGVALSVLSASEQSLLTGMMEERGILDFFGRVCGLPDLFAHSKLNLGRALLGNSETRPDETAIVGDTTHDYEVASELGCRCFLIAGGHQSAARLEACACPVFAGTDDAVGALLRASGTNVTSP